MREDPVTRYVIARSRDVLRGMETIDLPDAEHVHVTIINGTITAVPMLRIGSWFERTGTFFYDNHAPDESDAWVDAPEETP